MVQHICERCTKKFGHLSEFNRHKNRKFPCKLKDNSIVSLELEKQNILIEEQKNIIKEQQILNDELKQKNNTQDAIIKEKDKLLLSFANDMTKNNKLLKVESKKYLLTNLQKRYQNDYVYIIREREFVRLNENTYKVGRSKQVDIIDRFDKYPKGTEIICFFSVSDCIDCEAEIIKQFTELFSLQKDYGTEYFQGNVNEMLNVVVKIINNV
jgi:hypothetical protein